MKDKLYIASSIKYKDYLRYVFYPTFKKKALKNGFIISFILFSLMFIFLILSYFIVLIPKEYQTVLIISNSLYLFMLGVIVIKTLPSYLKNKDKFNADLYFVFNEDRISICNNNFKEGLKLFVKNIQYLDFKKKKTFIVLKDGKYYMGDNKRIYNGSIKDIKDWAIKHLSKN